MRGLNWSSFVRMPITYCLNTNKIEKIEKKLDTYFLVLLVADQRVDCLCVLTVWDSSELSVFHLSDLFKFELY